MTVWTGPDGPVPLGEGLVGAEIRGRIGHPASYGLLVARSAREDPGWSIDPVLQSELAQTVQVPGDRLFDAWTEPAYEAAIGRAAQEFGLRVVAVRAAEVSSASPVFVRLAAVIAEVLAAGPIRARFSGSE